MKPSFYLLWIAAVTMLLSACGQRGPLYLPTAPAPATPTQIQPAAATTAPASASAASSASK